jgi:thiol-disulfide isomerase/thioredoxin
MRHERRLLGLILLSVSLFASATVGSSPQLAGSWATPVDAAAVIQSGGYGRGSDPRNRTREGGAAAAPRGGATADGIEQGWLERMPVEDREPLDRLIGFAPPAFAGDLQWIGGDRVTWEELRGRLVVIQSWTGKTSGGRMLPQRTALALKEFSPDDVVLLCLHTPEGADKAAELAGKSAKGQRVIVDPSGVFCDELGIYKRPVNVVVDRDGAVRAAGLSSGGLTKAVALLAGRPSTPEATPPARDAPKTPNTPSAASWPTFNHPITAARDLRGQPGPALYVADWLTDGTTPNGRLVLVDFFASWCGPCLAAIPHMNDLARHYARDVCIIGLSNESRRALSEGLLRRNLKAKDFAYAVGVDPSKRMYDAIGVRSIPHCVIFSTDGVVRWQGHPSQLTAGVMDTLVAAHRAATAAAGGGGGQTKRGRWTGR